MSSTSPTASATPTPTDVGFLEKVQEALKDPVILGSVIGGGVFLIIVIIAIIVARKNRSKEDTTNETGVIGGPSGMQDVRSFGGMMSPNPMDLPPMMDPMGGGNPYTSTQRPYGGMGMGMGQMPSMPMGGMQGIGVESGFGGQMGGMNGQMMGGQMMGGQMMGGQMMGGQMMGGGMQGMQGGMQGMGTPMGGPMMQNQQNAYGQGFY